MKRIEDIEKLELEELEAAALSEAAPVPEGLEDRLRATLAAASLAEEIPAGAAEEPPCLLEKSRPGRFSPRGQAPGDRTPGDQARRGQAPGGQAPSDRAPRGQAPGGQAPSDRAPSDRAVRLTVWTAAIAAAAAVAIVLIPWHGPEPADTFDDPYLAYAQVEAAFERISAKISGGIDLAGETAETLSNPIDIIRKINSK